MGFCREASLFKPLLGYKIAALQLGKKKEGKINVSKGDVEIRRNSVFFKWLLSFGLAWFSPVTHAPFHRVETASMQTVCAYGHGQRRTLGHMNTLDGREHRETDCTATTTTRTTIRRQSARMKDCDHCVFKSIPPK